jgi:WD40 repeat protein
LRISVADGQTRELLSLKTRAVRASFSPDGRFVAYQVQPTSEADPLSRIFTLPADGGEPQVAYEERQNGKFSRWLKPCKLLDWTADGRYLAMASEHTGRGALDLLPIRDGKPAGAPIFVRNGDFWAIYVASLETFTPDGPPTAIESPMLPTTKMWDSPGTRSICTTSLPDRICLMRLISPDGRKVMVSADDYETGYELWSVENFEPPAPKP